MKPGLIFDIKRFAVHDGPGIRVTVFFKGCPLQCWWCHNPESRRHAVEEITTRRKLGGVSYRVNEQAGKWMVVEELMQEILKDRIFLEESGGGVTFSGGEPLLQPDFLEAVAAACREEGLHIALDTTGHAPAASLRRILPYTDLFLYDLKHPDGSLHKTYTGVDNRRILKNLRMLLDHGARVRIRIPVIPGINDREEDLAGFEALISSLGPGPEAIDLLPYHRLAAHKYETFGLAYRAGDIPDPGPDRLEQIRQRLAGSTRLPVGIGG